jgi:hypothetical protein
MTRLAYEALISQDSALALLRYCEIAEEFPQDSVAWEQVKRLGGA